MSDFATSFRIDAASFSTLPDVRTTDLLPPRDADPATETSEPRQAQPAVSGVSSPEPSPARAAAAENESVVVSDLLTWPSEEDAANPAVGTPTIGVVQDDPAEAGEAADQSSSESESVAKVAPETEQPRAAADEPTKPVWEVDRLRWPTICERLLKHEAEYFQHAGQKLHEASQQGLRVLAVTAASSGEGCTTLAACLAQSVATTGAKVALVDANILNPQLSTALGIELPTGWADAAAGKTPWTEVAVAALDPEITVLPGKRPTSSDVMAAPLAAARVLAEISEHFDLVILDLGPLAAESRYLWQGPGGSVVDAAIVVRDCRQTSQGKTLSIAANLKSLQVQAVGIAENYSSAAASLAAA